MALTPMAQTPASNLMALNSSAIKYITKHQNNANITTLYLLGNSQSHFAGAPAAALAAQFPFLVQIARYAGKSGNTGDIFVNPASVAYAEQVGNGKYFELRFIDGTSVDVDSITGL